jgi:hypothetical protein
MPRPLTDFARADAVVSKADVHRSRVPPVELAIERRLAAERGPE